MDINLVSGTEDFLTHLIEKEQLTSFTLLKTPTQALLYTTDGIESTNEDSIHKLLVKQQDNAIESPFVHFIYKSVFPDFSLELVHTLFTHFKTSIHDDTSQPLQILFNAKHKTLILISQWPNSKQLNNWINSDAYNELFIYLKQFEKHYLHNPYTRIYESVHINSVD